MSDSSYAPPGAQSSVMDPELWSRLYLSTASQRERVCAFAYNHSLLVSSGLQITVIVAFLLFDPHTLQTGYAMNATMTVVLILLQLLQLFFIIAAHVGMLRELVALYVRPIKIWNIYMTSLLCFAALYFTCFAYDRASFNVDGYAPSGVNDSGQPIDAGAEQDTQTYNDVLTVFLFFVYFSGAIITSTGFGDIAPAAAYTQFFSNLEMLLGVLYSVGVFGLTLAHFRTMQRLSEEERQQRQAEDPSLLSSVLSLVDRLQLAKRIRNIHPRLDQFRRLCVRHLALFSIAFQTLTTLLLFAIPGSPFDALTSADGSRYTIKLTIISLMVVLQFGLFVTVLLISFRLVRSINSTDLSAQFLVQSYIATALLFGGIYFILFAATPTHQFSRQVDFTTNIFSVLYIFVHFSLTVMTTTGFGDIYARGVIARMFVLVHMLVSILYNAVIIGLGTSQLIDMQSAKAEVEFSRMRIKAQEDEASRRSSVTGGGREDGEEEEGDDDMRLDEGDDDEDEEEEDGPFDRAAAERRREQRRLAGGDHIQLAVMHPHAPSMVVSSSRVGAVEQLQEEDGSEAHMFGHTEPGDRDSLDEEEEEELDMKTYGSIDEEEEEAEQMQEAEDSVARVEDEHEDALSQEAKRYAG